VIVKNENTGPEPLKIGHENLNFNYIYVYICCLLEFTEYWVPMNAEFP
jgi:hypothetical protein